jgi:hypothetical protein
MKLTIYEFVKYEPPTIEIIETMEILYKMGPFLSCSAFEGSNNGGE